MKKVGLLSLFLLAACAHHRDVRPGADGIHRVVIKTESKDEGARQAMSQAEHFCEEKYKKGYAVVGENSKFTGSMDEESYNKAKTISKVASASGGALMAFGGRKEKNVGGVMAVGGGIANSALGAGYTFEMRFKCQ